MAWIRRAQPDDTEACENMAWQFLVDSPHGAYLSRRRDALSVFVEEMLVLNFREPDRAAVFVVDADDRQLVGMLVLLVTVVPMTLDTVVEEVAWWVHPDYRKGTLGPRLMACGERWARTTGARVLRMLAPSGSNVGRYLEHRQYAALETSYMLRLDGAEATHEPVHTTTEPIAGPDGPRPHGAGTDDRPSHRRE